MNVFAKKVLTNKSNCAKMYDARKIGELCRDACISEHNRLCIPRERYIAKRGEPSAFSTNACLRNRFTPSGKLCLFLTKLNNLHWGIV